MAPYQPLDKLAVEYIKSQLESGQAVRTKRALQELCKLYRRGLRIRPEQLTGIEQTVVGLLSTQSENEKIRRWALNTIARVGREQFCLAAVTDTLKKFDTDPQTLAAAIAAIYKMSRNASDILKSLKFSDEKLVALAGLQHVDATKLNLSRLTVDIEKSTADHLKLALIVVGLNRAPFNLFHPRHNNAQIVKQLGKHSDNIVSQYSVWAIVENNSLSLSDLGMDIKLIEQQPPNVRSWLFQLIAMSTTQDTIAYIDYISLGSKDPESEARMGLAVGLENTFFDGIDELVLEWFFSEPETEVRQHLLDHIIKQSDRHSTYESMAINLYEKEPSDSRSRQRMEVSAVGTSLFSKFRRISYDGSNDLFRHGGNMSNTTININGNIQGAAVAVGGNASNSGTASNYFDSATINAIQSELSMAERQVQVLENNEALKRQALEYIKAAQENPASDNLSKVIKVLKRIENFASKAANLSISISTIITKLGQLTGLG